MRVLRKMVYPILLNAIPLPDGERPTSNYTLKTKDAGRQPEEGRGLSRPSPSWQALVRRVGVRPLTTPLA